MDNNNTNSSPGTIELKWMYSILLYLGFPIIITGIVSNTLSLLMFRKDFFTPVSTKCLLQTLCVTDIIFLFSVIIYIEFKTIFQIYPGTKPTLAAIRGNLVVNYIVTVVIMISEFYRNWLTVLIGIERFFVTCYPFAMRFTRKKHSIVAILCVLALTIILRIPIIIRTTYSTLIKVHKQNNANFTSTKFYIYHKNISDNFYSLHSILEAVFQSFLPICILLFCSIRIVRALRESNNLHHRSNQTQSSQVTQASKITRMLILVIAIFTITNSPHLITVFLSNFDSDYLKLQSSIAWLFSMIYSSTNFFIYIIYTKRYRIILMKMFCRFNCCYEEIRDGTVGCQIPNNYTRPEQDAYSRDKKADMMDCKDRSDVYLLQNRNFDTHTNGMDTNH